MIQPGDVIALFEQVSKLGLGFVSACILIFGAAWFMWQLKPLIENNTKAIEAMSNTVEMFGTILTKTSDKVIAHDERSISIQHEVTGLAEQVNGLQKDVSEIKGQLRAG